MKSFSEAVQLGVALCVEQARRVPGKTLHVPAALALRVARKILRDDGVPNPPKTLLNPLYEAILEESKWEIIREDTLSEAERESEENDKYQKACERGKLDV